MLTIEKNLNAPALTVALIGRLDTTTAPELEKELKASLDGITELSFESPPPACACCSPPRRP